MAYLRHDNIVALYDFFWDDTNFYLVIDYCPGGELFDYIVEHDKLTEPESAYVFQQIVSAIAYCHKSGVAHRDLKPENILITKFPHIKVSDFGLCGFISEQQMMKTFCGSPCYCSPECLCRVQYDGRKSDIWSLGVILYAMVTGEHPWNVSNTSIMLRQILKGLYTIPSYVSSDCRELIGQMMRVNPQERASIEDVLKHPWLKIADKLPIARKSSQVCIIMPPEQNLSLIEISEANAQTSKLSNHGIVSPFEDNVKKKDPETELSGLPKLCIRSSSVESLKEKRNSNKTARKNLGLTGLPTLRRRQKSAVNLLAHTLISPKLPKSMAEIMEEP
ncbi:CAMK family protein kinase [Histomonas meleagridis]|uniref:CAMK family protein kinase n=1 Tax=Histomonas meleagridis TaxID=135588 RepID=UPI00355A9611|nr:CAMK family protein kinase [Histomonas meleagridis]KAH0806964.1 CAMK family protein kinase [Histomonas meleagridis]